MNDIDNFLDKVQSDFPGIKVKINVSIDDDPEAEIDFGSKYSEIVNTNIKQLTLNGIIIFAANLR